MTRFVAVAITLVACADPPGFPPARFANEPPVRVVDDRRTIPQPRRSEMLEDFYSFDTTVARRLTRPLELPGHARAIGVNALDEVPDSSWFTNRIGVRDMSLDELRTGPNVIGNPAQHTPWTIHSNKNTGESHGFLVTDSRGEKFLIKFDRKGFPEVETATHVIVARLLWACGYNVTDDYIAYVWPGDFRVAPDATERDKTGRARPFRTADLATIIASVEKLDDGRIRVLASHMLVGKALGGFAGDSTRVDDPNDVIPHELRRDLRGALPIFAWLDYGDVKLANTLDMFVHDPTRDSNYVVHYWLDYGKSLGAAAFIDHDRRLGFEYNDADFAKMWGSLVTFGLRPRPFEDRPIPEVRGTGMFTAHDFAPGHWRPYTPEFLALRLADAVDWFWGAKILMHFTREQLRAIVEAGRFSDPRAVSYLTDALVARQQATMLYAFSRVSPLDAFAMVNGALCFDDLLLRSDLLRRPTSYGVQTFTRDARPILRSEQQLVPLGAHTCTSPLMVSRAADGYTIVRIDTRSGNDVHRVYVHIARDPLGSGWHVIGIWRE